MASRFLHHTACPSCGSSDARAIYSDGGEYCFSCGTIIRSNMSGYVRQALIDKDDTEPVIILPDDVNYEYSQECIEWLKNYGLTPSDMIKRGVKWSARYNQLIFVYQYMDRTGIGCMQARNFTSGRTKYYNQGDVNQVLPIYYYNNRGDSTTLAIVEDAISAIKVTRNCWVDAMPLLGSHMPVGKINKIHDHKYSEVIVWLDHDKYKEALQIAEKFRIIGIKAYVVTSDLDPKCYDSTTIAKKLGIIQ